MEEERVKPAEGIGALELSGESHQERGKEPENQRNIQIVLFSRDERLERGDRKKSAMRIFFVNSNLTNTS